MAPVLHSYLGMPVSHLMGLEETPEGLIVTVRWKGLSNSEDSLERLANFYSYFPQIFERFLRRKKTPPSLVHKARAALAT